MLSRRNRLEFGSDTKRDALHRSGGICECLRVPVLMEILKGIPCERPLSTGNIEFDHIISDAIRPDNSLENCAALTKTCHAIKTPRDRMNIADAKRQHDRHFGIKTVTQPIEGGRDDPRKRTMGGVVVDRRTGERWGAR
jgi:5-methylcytosine-specific restriction endonuclease McrA